MIEGPVESFAPVARAKELTESFARRWCDTYHSFNKKSVFDVTLLFKRIISIGQMVSLSGDLLIGNDVINMRGNLNTKSNQIELIINSDHVLAGLEESGSFIGFYSSKRLSWHPNRLNNAGGMLIFNDFCDSESLKP